MCSRGKRTLASTVDLIAERDPDRTFAVVPQGLELADGFETLNMKDVSRAINSLCWWLEKTLGDPAKGEVVAYMGSNDARYLFFVLACQKTGHQAFLPSTRNAHQTTIDLLESMSCTKFFYSEERRLTVLELQRLLPGMHIFQVPSTKATLSAHSCLRPYKMTKSYEESEDDVACIIHSSGTTGIPKPLFLTHGFFSTMDSFSTLPCPAGRRSNMFHDIGDPVLVITPFFHIMGFLSFVISIFHGTPVVFGPDKPPYVNHIVELLQKTRPAAASFPPSILGDLITSKDGVRCLRNLRYVFVGGAPLAPKTGDFLSRHTQVIPMIGSSEVGWIPALAPQERGNWEYFEWNPAFGVEMRDTGNGIFELVIPRRDHSHDFHGVFHLYPHLDIYHTKDLYTQHPRSPNLWKFYGRKDDLIVLSNGEKFNPVPLEQIIERSPLVRSAVIVGEGRLEAALLIEPSSYAPDVCSGSFIEKIWPTVLEANRISAGHARIIKSRIKLADQNKPFTKTPKGTTQRQNVIKSYETEIQDIYAHDLAGDLERFPSAVLDFNNVSAYIRELVQAVLERSDISDKQDLYNSGLDSLTTPQLCSMILRGISHRRPGVKKDIVTPQKIYENPTIERLARMITDTVEGKVPTAIPRKHKIQKLVDRYTANLPRIEHHLPVHTSGLPSTVILTGSTGSLGSYLLYLLISTSSITKIYCLNRSEDAATKQKRSFEDKGLLLDHTSSFTKVEFVKVSLGEPKLALHEDKYKELLQSVDAIIHAAWKVDFSQSIDTFEDPHIKGVRQLVDFSIQSVNHAHIHFISSVATVSHHTSEIGCPVLELPSEDSSLVVPKGYAESKHTAERILWVAACRSCVPVTIHRVGQVAGPRTRRGKWNPHEWLPTLIATSISIGKIPTTLGNLTVDWIPVDDVSKIIIDIVNSRHKQLSASSCAFFHLNNPSSTSWSSLTPVIHKRYQVEEVDMSQWIAELGKIQEPTDEQLKAIPGLKLLPFYHRLLKGPSGEKNALTLDVHQAQEISKTMRILEPISPELMDNWLRQWDF